MTSGQNVPQTKCPPKTQWHTATWIECPPHTLTVHQTTGVVFSMRGILSGWHYARGAFCPGFNQPTYQCICSERSSLHNVCRTHGRTDVLKRNTSHSYTYIRLIFPCMVRSALLRDPDIPARHILPRYFPQRISSPLQRVGVHCRTFPSSTTIIRRSTI